MTVKNLLRPRQVQENRDELSKIEGMLSAPPHLRSKISDLPGMMARKKRLAQELSDYTPRPYTPEEKDAAVKKFDSLRAEIAQGMPSSEEMRRNPPGAVQKHQAWEKRNKTQVMEMKHMGLRLYAGGDVPEDMGEAVTNVELLRGHSRPTDLSMDHAQIPKRTDFHFGADIANTVTFNDAEIAVLTELSPGIADKLGLLPSEVRAGIKAALVKAGELNTSRPKKVKLTPRNGDNHLARLRKLAKGTGINSFGMKMAALEAALRDKGLTLPE